MKISRLLSLGLIGSAVVMATIVACSDEKKNNPTLDASNNQSDAKIFMDAAASSNALGQLCPFGSGGGGTMCPAMHNCVRVQGVGTNMNTGYCTPNCMGMNAICTTGYSGPSGGMPVCALQTGSGSGANGCAIVCTTAAQCPTGMSCVQVPMQNVKICVPT